MVAMNVQVCSEKELTPGSMRTIKAGTRSVSVCNSEGRLYAFDDTCLHKGGPLGQGKLEGEVVTCPWHAWKWNVVTGASLTNPNLSVKTYVVSVENGFITVTVE